jgi:hypothetical protein
MSASTTSAALQKAVFTKDQQAALLLTWQTWQNSGSRPPSEKKVYVYNAQEWLQRVGPPMDLIKDLEYLRRESPEDICVQDNKWVHRLVQTDFWKDLIERDALDLAELPIIQRQIDTFKDEMKANAARNHRVQQVCVLYDQLDMVPLKDKMAKYLSRPYAFNRILCSASVLA